MSTLQRRTRYQAAIMRSDDILLIRHQEHASGRTYWLLPGGGREDGETEEECLRREMLEETGLVVRIERLLFDHPTNRKDGVYQNYKTYLCTAVSGDPRPGYEPEIEASSLYGIVEVRWFNLWDETNWDDIMRHDPITYTNLENVRKSLISGPVE